MKINHSFSSPNYSDRLAKQIDCIILHYTEMTFNDALQKLCEPLAEVSAHYLIKEDGEIFQLVKDEYRAWHAGKSYWAGRDNINDCSIGIELDNLGDVPFKEQQMRSSIDLCKYLSLQYNIPPQNILGHSDIAPSRKVDPGIFFDWQRLATEGLGIWPNKIIPSAPLSCVTIQEKLQKIGYQIKITGRWDEQTAAVSRAFQFHFCQEYIFKLGIDIYNNTQVEHRWTEESSGILNALLD
jgi:N-acetylmuramoyl-L-alanine amidase